MIKAEERGLRWFIAQLRGQGPAARLTRGAGTAFGVKVAGTLVVFANQVLLARVLGVDAYGQYIYVVTWVGLLGILAVAGFNTSAVRFVPEYRVAGASGLLRGFLRQSNRIVLAISLIVSVCLAIVVWALGDRIEGDLARVFWIGCILLPVAAHLELRSASLRGMGRILAAQGPLQVLRPVLFGAGVIGLYFLKSEGVSAPWAMLANLAATLVSLGLIEVVLRRFLSGDECRPSYRTREWLAVSLPLLLMAGFGVLLSSTDTLMLGLIKGTTEAGIYAVASRAASFVPFMLIAVNTMAGPLIAEYYSVGDRERLQRMLRVGAWAAFGFGVLVSVALILAGRPVLRIFGAEFEIAYVPLLILVAAQLVLCLTGSVGGLLTLTGHQNRATLILGGGAFLNIVLNLLLIPGYGARGAAVATAVSVITWNSVQLGVVLRTVGVNPSVLPFLRRWI